MVELLFARLKSVVVHPHALLTAFTPCLIGPGLLGVFMLCQLALMIRQAGVISGSVCDSIRFWSENPFYLAFKPSSPSTCPGIHFFFFRFSVITFSRNPTQRPQPARKLAKGMGATNFYLRGGPAWRNDLRLYLPCRYPRPTIASVWSFFWPSDPAIAGLISGPILATPLRFSPSGNLSTLFQSLRVVPKQRFALGHRPCKQLVSSWA